MRDQFALKHSQWVLESHKTASLHKSNCCEIWVTEIISTLIHNNGSEFLGGDRKQWCESLVIEKLKSTIYHPRANVLTERAVQTVKRAIED